MESQQELNVTRRRWGFIQRLVLATMCGIGVIAMLTIVVLFLTLSIFITGTKSLRGANNV